QVPVREDYFPSVSINALIVQEGDIYTANAELNVQRTAQKMNVVMTPDQQKYLPGKTARYTIKTTDANGKPIPAQVGMGVVDESIYALRKDITPNPEVFFWGEQPDLTSTDFSMSKSYSGGAYQIMAQQAASQSNVQGIRLRKKFADTAYWNPDIMTGADGTAKVDFTLPDNLTSWRATARGINAKTQVGQGTSKIQVNMPMEVHLALPRFYVHGDKAVVSASVHNNTDVDRDIKIHAQTVGATLQGDADQTIHLTAHSAKRLTWHAEITTGTKVNGTPQLAYFTVSADGGDNAKDAMQLSLPVQPLGLKMVEAHSNGLYQKDATANIDLSKLPQDASIELEMKPSLAAVIYDGLDYIQTYPYQNAEQTASTLITNVAVASSLSLRSPGFMPADLRQQINFALQRLYRYQHQDGGWQMWEFDQSDPRISAYVLTAMAKAKRAGFLVDDYRLQRGSKYLEKHPDYDSGDIVYAQFLLSKPADVIARFSDISTPSFLNVKENTARQLAANILLQNEVIGAFDLQEEKQKKPLSKHLQMVKAHWVGLRQKSIEELNLRAIKTGDLIRWKAPEKGYSWYSDDVETTAVVLHALIDADSNSSMILPAMRWLLAQPWHSTKATAETVLAMTAYLSIHGELTPNYNVQLALDGKPLQYFAVDQKSLQEPPVKVLLSPEDWRGHHTLSINKSGDGSLYFTTTIRYLLPPSQSNEADHGIKVTREYTVTVKNPSLSQKMESGTDMQVTLHLDLPESYRYVTLEEPIPAGYEVAP
ncbi:MAG: alpha-2-macroglobulin family protein, partial [Abditibacteriaceae bacterium]